MNHAPRTSFWHVASKSLIVVMIDLSAGLLVLGDAPSFITPAVWADAQRGVPVTVPRGPAPPSTGRASALQDARSVAAAVVDLRKRNLTVPVEGITRTKLVDSFRDRREEARIHEAIDILAPRGTPVIAVDAGTIEKFFSSVRGGLTIYEFDASRTYAYYYAHLERYQTGLKEHDRVARGQIIGFVGTTGNAPKNTPHLHFGITLLTDKKQWWGGTALNPYDIWQPER